MASHAQRRAAGRGGVTNPFHIYPHKLDNLVETVSIPQHTQGRRRKANPAYTKAKNRLQDARQRGDRAAARELRRQLHRLPCGDPQDPRHRRLRYSRYADDHLLGFTGPKAEAETIKQQSATFQRDELALELNADKTLITHARTCAARYLGYEIIAQHADSKITRDKRSVNGTIALRVPREVIKAKYAPYLWHGKPCHRQGMQNLDDYDIVKAFAAEYQGVVQYYLLANDVWRLHRFQWAAQTSMPKTLASKHQSTVPRTAARHRAEIQTPRGPRRCYEARVERHGKPALVARFGGIPLARKRDAVIIDELPGPVTYPRKELIIRLLTGRCELCEEPAKVVAHQVRRLASLDTTGADQPLWAAHTASKRRKTLVVCRACHDAIHHAATTA